MSRAFTRRQVLAAAAGAMLPSNGDDYIFHIPSLPVWIVDSACYCNYTAFS